MSTKSKPSVPRANVTRAVVPTILGHYCARPDGLGGFFFLLQCGHKAACKTRWNPRGPGVVPVPEKAEWRPCETCKAALVAEGKPIPRCPLCRGRGGLVTQRSSGSCVSISSGVCPACRGKTTGPNGEPEPPEPKGIDLRGLLGDVTT